MKIVVLDAATLELPASEWADLKAMGELEVYDLTESNEQIILDRCRGAQVVFANKVPLPASTLAALPELKFIGILATGVNNVDLKAAARQGVAVCNVPGYSTQSVVQHTIALILALTNRVTQHSASVYRGDWVRSQRFSYWLEAPQELAGETVGVVGFGDIGAGVARVLAAFGAQVLIHRRNMAGEPGIPGASYSSLDELFSRSKIVSLHCPLTADNAEFVNANLLQSMPQGAYLVNTARGGLIREQDLAEALNSGHLAGAAVDVVSVEPMRPDNALLNARNLVITPHIAWASLPARTRLLRESIVNLRSFINRERTNRVVLIGFPARIIFCNSLLGESVRMLPQNCYRLTPSSLWRGWHLL
ncbi:MAG: D-2-hydroxyacid dehydrogenase [Verrucomicrobia bacterium]|nr:D-2-hydroxyacid dehydrogenase [Verrucomicrobiota bacterium]